MCFILVPTDRGLVGLSIRIELGEYIPCGAAYLVDRRQLPPEMAERKPFALMQIRVREGEEGEDSD